MNQSESLYQQAQTIIPGGVNSPVRAFKSVNALPPFIAKAKGAYLTDADGKQYIDYVGSWGPMILGHTDADVVSALQQQAEIGMSYGAPCAHEIKLAEMINHIMPSIEMIRFVSSGTEATMSAIRLARAYTKCDKIIKFKGCYHGHADHLLVEAGSGALTLGVPTSPGVPKDTAKHTLTADFNDIASVEKLFEANPEEISCVIIEPIAGNMNLIFPKDDFLQKVQALCKKHGALFIMDEVMTGFRVGLKGVQGLYDLNPDLTTLGKVIGGGMPVGAFGGKKEIMQMIAPAGPVYQAGTLSGNPLAMVAGIKTLEKIQQPGFYDQLSEKTLRLVSGLNNTAKEANYPFYALSVGSMFGLFFTDKKEITSFDEVQQCDIEQFILFFNHMLKNGIYLAPSAYEAGFMSIAHTNEDIDQTINLAKAFFNQ